MAVQSDYGKTTNVFNSLDDVTWRTESGKQFALVRSDRGGSRINFYTKNGDFVNKMKARNITKFDDINDFATRNAIEFEVDIKNMINDHFNVDNTQYFLTSAKSGENIKELFEHLFKLSKSINKKKTIFNKNVDLNKLKIVTKKDNCCY